MQLARHQNGKHPRDKGNPDCGDFQTLYTDVMTRTALHDHTIVLIGLMGAGKTTVGRRLAAAMDRPFADADHEIERAAGRSVSEIFEDFGEAAFRDGERRVIARLLDQPPMVLALGGGAFVDPDTRTLIANKAISIWLQADVETLATRVARRDTRPLLRDGNPVEILERLLETRQPAYAEADIHIDASAGTHQATADAIIAALKDRETQK
ncbi:shikimate kinase [Maricaulis salignorans]|uniref:Shikimate kinase n=2 Tax=Maricaulis salignorans TaxID=144026 RepID=A0A1G9N6C6_9PROT|nr:shikimate kinase [Maricaulis salignorans]SDL82086.1 shikimate kinase [Maricaulis salignorans]